MPDDVTIVSVEVEDVERLVALAREIWYAHYPAIIGTAQIEYMLGQRYNSDVVLAELRRDGVWWDKLMVAGEMAGFASYFLTGDPGEMKLDKLYVHPRHQRRGYGGMMIVRACAAARARLQQARAGGEQEQSRRDRRLPEARLQRRRGRGQGYRRRLCDGRLHHGETSDG